MKKKLIKLCIAYLSLGELIHSHGPNCPGHHDAPKIEFGTMAMSCFNQVAQWYNAHAFLANSIAAVGVTYLLYKNYCPVASRCPECSEDLTN